MSEQRAPYDIAPLTDDEFNQIFGSGKDAAPLTENDFAGILGDVPNLPAGWNYPERGERAPSADRVAAMRYKIDNQRATLAQMQLQYDKMKSNAEKLAHDLRKRDLTLATLCDMVLGEDAADRSDGALVRAVGEMKRERDAAIADRDNALIDVRNMQARLQRIIDANTQATRKLRAAIETQPQALPGSPDLVDELIAQRDAAQAKLAEYEGENKRWHSFETVQAIVKERDAATKRAEQAEADAHALAKLLNEVDEANPQMSYSVKAYWVIKKYLSSK